MEQALLQALGLDVLSSRELQDRLGANQKAISRAIIKAGDRVVRIGRGRATRYGRAHQLFAEAGLSQPLFCVGDDGVAEEVGLLRALERGDYYLDRCAEASIWLRGESRIGLFESLPYFLYDLRPAGFLGRQLARRLADAWGVSSDPRRWGDREIGRYLLREGHDLPGNLVLGELAARRVGVQTSPTVTDRARDYPELARRSLADGVPGSSATGEQPKFAVHLADVGHVIVKFSPAGDAADARRWQDLLIAEAHASAVLAAHGVLAAMTRATIFDGRVFLESQRFDRVGTRGRRPTISLEMVDAEFAGKGPRWSDSAAELHRRRLLDEQSLEQIVWAETFGEWIGNSDMHGGNLSLAPVDDGFAALPIYDMLPMAYAPIRGARAEVTLRSPLRTALNRAVWEPSRQAACELWRRIASDDRVSEDFVIIADENARAL